MVFFSKKQKANQVIIKTAVDIEAMPRGGGEVGQAWCRYAVD